MSDCGGADREQTRVPNGHVKITCTMRNTGYSVIIARHIHLHLTHEGDKVANPGEMSIFRGLARLEVTRPLQSLQTAE